MSYMEISNIEKAFDKNEVLKGISLNIEQGEAAHTKGWHLLCVEGYPLGFGKLVGNTFKNKYPAGWRV